MVLSQARSTDFGFPAVLIPIPPRASNLEVRTGKMKRGKHVLPTAPTVFKKGLRGRTRSCGERGEKKSESVTFESNAATKQAA